MSNLEVTVPAPDRNVMTAAANKCLVGSQGTVIDSPEMYQFTADDLKTIKGRMKDIEDLRVKLVTPFNAAVKALNDAFRQPREIYEQAESNLKRAMLTYDQEQERKRQEEIARARREAEEKAARERAALAAKAAEEQAKADAEAKKLRDEAEAARAAGNAAQAAKLESKAESRMEVSASRLESLQEAHEQVQAAPVVVAMAEAPRAAGIATRKVWKWEVTDKAAAIKFIAEHPEWLKLVEFDTTAMNSAARALGAELPITGVRVFQESQIASRAA